MKRAMALAGLLLLAIAQPVSAAPAGLAQNPCCGQITAAGQALAARLDNSGVQYRWLAGHHVNWLTGQADGGAEDNGHGAASHCSAFVAAFARQVGVYVLHPPEHSQILLASAQLAWLAGPRGAQSGWQPVANMVQAQALANQGLLVIVGVPGRTAHKPGHIAIVHPAMLSPDALAAHGPMITQAGEDNAVLTTTREGFKYHHGAWPDGLVWFSHKA